MYFDSHTHLNSEQLFADYEYFLKKFEENGGKGLMNVAVDMDRALKAVEIQKNNNTSLQLFSSIGYHPSLVANENIYPYQFENILNEMEQFYNKNIKYIYAIGECGIDVHYSSKSETLSSQKKFFMMQCELAQKLDLPVIIHSRDDFESTYDIIKNFPKLKIYFHCWGYGANEINVLQENFENIWIGYTGNITFPKAENIRESFLATEKQNILIETDAPYLTPHPYRGKINDSSYIKYIYEYTANLIDYDLDNYIDIIEDNFFALYG
ncbi:TatD family hydrolase [Candidatus Vampirococcus lugosii]|uniref:Hydrolase TatD n=1 Tax=Candidatus Vampirococcus lugosii TaxID=2789015 RepID=A0ABS5QM67_9BACT|nr:TatD family hydrolase [Candidatus Vampirococcus lugosii]MBS8122157.1 hydrolase TatD [Candidatus Vampirococcus lugosii]